MFPIVLIKWKKKAASKVSFINCIQDPWTAPWPHTLAGAILHDKSVALSPTLTRSAVCTLITALEGPPRKTTPLNTYLQQHQLTGNIHAKYSAWKIKSLQTISSKNPSIAERQTKPTYCSVLQLTVRCSNCSRNRKSVSVPVQMVFSKTNIPEWESNLPFTCIKTYPCLG